MDITHYPMNWLPYHEDDRVITVGWLAPDEAYSRGKVSAEFVSALFRLLLDPWQPAISMGFHHCPFCEFSGGPDAFSMIGSNEKVSMGRDNLYVPGDDCVFVTPSLILHYIDSHQFCPREDFQQAVLDCPPMRSMEYLKALRANAPESVLRIRRDTSM